MLPVRAASSLGLAIVKRAANLIGHNLSLETELGRGTTLTVLLSAGR